MPSNWVKSMDNRVATSYHWPENITARVVLTTKSSDRKVR